MAGQVSPGIVLKERDLTTQTIVTTQANTAAIVGSFEKGPVGTITNIATEKELVEIFGKPNNSNYEDWFTASSFLSYGGQLQVVRVEDPSLKNAISDPGTSSTDATKLYVAASASFSTNDLVKVDNEYFLVTSVTNTVGEKSLTVTRAQLGTAAVNHSNGATVAKWDYAESGTSTTLAEPNASPELSAVETFITVASVVGFAVNDYAKIKRVPTGGVAGTTSEIVKIVSIDTEANILEVERGQLGTTAITFDDDVNGGETAVTVSLIKMTFALTSPGVSSTLSEAYPRVTVVGVTPPLIKSLTQFEASYAGYAWKFAARTAGSWANGIKIVSIDGGVASYDTENVYGSTKWSTIAADPGTADDLHIAVLDADNNVLETFLYVSRVSTAKDEQGASKYYVDVINRKSSYVYAGAPGLAAGNSTLSLSGGVSVYPTTGSVIYDSFDLFLDTEEVNVDFVLTGGSVPLLADQISKANKAIAVANGRKDCVAFVSPHNAFVTISSATSQRDNIITFFDSLTSTSYAVFDSGYKYIYDRYNDKYRFIPCCADVAGLCVETSTNLEDWYSPSGLNRGNLKNVVKLAYTPTKTDRDKLYQKRINPITTFPGQGTVLFGDKTALATPSAFDRINVRRLFLAVEKRISQLAKGVLFELNDGATRAAFANAANSYLAEVKSKRGVTDYLVVCDETNNTADVIDRNEFVAEIYMKPSRSINYITITFVATRSGVSFAEVTGQ